MKDLFGSPGKVSGLVLRIGQCLFAVASIVVMASSSGFYTATAFCYLIASMGLQVLWSFGLACLDAHALRKKRDLQNQVLVSLFVVGDWVTAILTLAAACSSAGVMVLFIRDSNFCSKQIHVACGIRNKGPTVGIMVYIALLYITVSNFGELGEGTESEGFEVI